MISRRTWRGAALCVAALALAASVNSIANGYAYDDNYLIVKAARTHSLAGWWRDFAQTYWPREWGGDGYRPLSAIAFRVQWVAGSGSPVVFHSLNVVLHVVTSVAVLWLACGVLPFAAAAVAAALYAVHPVHVEAIANVVGQSELWVALLVVTACGLSRCRDGWPSPRCTSSPAFSRSMRSCSPRCCCSRRQPSSRIASHCSSGWPGFACPSWY
jgi:hypothetical protein